MASLGDATEITACGLPFEATGRGGTLLPDHAATAGHVCRPAAAKHMRSSKQKQQLRAIAFLLGPGPITRHMPSPAGSQLEVSRRRKWKQRKLDYCAVARVFETPPLSLRDWHKVMSERSRQAIPQLLPCFQPFDNLLSIVVACSTTTTYHHHPNSKVGIRILVLCPRFPPR